MGMAAVETLTPDDLTEADPIPGGVRKNAFLTENNIVVHAQADGNGKTP